MFAFHTCEQGQRKGKRKRKMKNTDSMPLRFKFKPRWRPSLISFPESMLPDCWFRVTRTLGTKLPPSWDNEMRVRVPFCLRSRSTCERRLRLGLRRTCEPAFTVTTVVKRNFSFTCSNVQTARHASDRWRALSCHRCAVLKGKYHGVFDIFC